jgi:hypothetical protein
VTAGELTLVVAAVLGVIGFAALVVALMKVLEALTELRAEVAAVREQVGPLVDELRTSTRIAGSVVDQARVDLERFDRVLGSAEAISSAMAGSGRVARTALSTPVIKTAALATGTSRAVRRLRRKDDVR